MNDVAAPLSSVHSTVEEATKRIAAMATGADRSGDEDVAMSLWEIERNLQAAVRRMETLQRRL